jgi:hypothetical protein
MLQVGRLQKLLNWLESHLEWIVYELRRLLGYFEVKYFPFLVSLDDIVAAMEFILDQWGTVLGSERIGFGLFGIIRIARANHLFPLDDRISLRAIGVDQDHYTTLSGAHVVAQIFKVIFMLMFIKEIFDFFLTEFALEHVFDGKEFGVLDEGEDLIELVRIKDCVGLDDCDGVGEVLLFGVEEKWFLLELGLGGGHGRWGMEDSKWIGMISYD